MHNYINIQCLNWFKKNLITDELAGKLVTSFCHNTIPKTVNYRNLSFKQLICNKTTKLVVTM